MTRKHDVGFGPFFSRDFADTFLTVLVDLVLQMGGGQINALRADRVRVGKAPADTTNRSVLASATRVFDHPSNSAHDHAQGSPSLDLSHMRMPLRLVIGSAKVQKELPHWFSLRDGISKSDQTKIAEDTYRRYQSLPKVSILAIDEVGSPESPIQVPGQRVYTGRKPVISSSLADTPCASLGVDGLLEKLNITLGTLYTLDSPSLPSRLSQKLYSALRIPHTSSLSLILRSCISSNYDFGTAYARLRSRWYDDLSHIEDTLRAHEARDTEIRRVIQVNKRITSSSVPPLRLWDLYSNRVVPWWVAIWSSVNGLAWPVPLPKDVDLRLLRIELLNLGAEYVWLDVLCLRQADGPNEDLRAKEWELDVPAIGNV
ncbi:uncharacterized protein EV420DRAFT_1701555 [Desarmillaria tabescens]|uniref:Heterokaryon incompatibility domain-containing protein n=1 Tax=Armillaria tabescens TaxID=1929756 RepID=A0AA39K2T6_ARMTA|nr:uncharacterized protein EV420DRAFT_1701555 [Desarmillaria tabescens]KAK0452124.1 hypothetical protein EV420DRAFT_1701555 [Desarmillaria tabescens]